MKKKEKKAMVKALVGEDLTTAEINTLIDVAAKMILDGRRDMAKVAIDGVISMYDGIISKNERQALVRILVDDDMTTAEIASVLDVAPRLIREDRRELGIPAEHGGARPGKRELRVGARGHAYARPKRRTK